MSVGGDGQGMKVTVFPASSQSWKKLLNTFIHSVCQPNGITKRIWTSIMSGNLEIFISGTISEAGPGSTIPVWNWV